MKLWWSIKGRAHKDILKQKWSRARNGNNNANIAATGYWVLMFPMISHSVAKWGKFNAYYF